MRNDRWWCEPRCQKSIEAQLDKLHHEELSLSFGFRAVPLSNDGTIASSIRKVLENVILDLVDELAQEPNDVWMRWKLHELDELVYVGVASLRRVEIKVEAHFESVLLVEPHEAWCRASHESNHAKVSLAKHPRHLELAGSSTSSRHESLLMDLISCSCQALIESSEYAIACVVQQT